MPMWNCDFDNCQKPAVRTYGECTLCDRHLCTQHLQAEFHKCPAWEDAESYDPAAGEAERRELTQLLSKINTPALASRASHLRNGIPCSIPPLVYDRAIRSSVMGGMNYHVEIRFEDGVSWLARIRRSNATSPPPDLRDHIIRSEVATLQFLEKTGVPAPRVFDFDFERKENPVGVGYILMEKMPGKSLRWSLLSADQRKKVMSQLADIYITLHSFPFQSAGSFDQPGTSHIGSFARESLTDYHPSGEMRPLGPYSSHEQYLIATLRLTLSLIVRQECYTPRAVDAYLIHRYLLDCIPAILSQHTHDDGYFYLKHADEKGDHILIDSSLNITSIIDWEWAHTAPKSSAFKSPIVLLSVSDFYAGINTLGDDEAIFAQLLEEKGNPELAEIVKRGRILHRFEFCAGYDLADWDGFLGLFQGLRSALDSDAQLDWPAWREMAIRRYAHEEELRLLLEEDRGRG